MLKSAKSKSANKRSARSSAATAASAAKPDGSTPVEVKSQGDDPASKQSQVIGMLQSPSGTTLAAMMKVTGWQQHSVRGFLAGVVRKRLKLKLASKKLDGERIYQITGAGGGGCGARGAKRRPS
jgi:Protein of unknown function (DUF3489)